MRVIGNWIVKYDVNTRHIWRESTNMKLEEKLRQTIRLKHYSLKTEENYAGWYRRFMLWHRERCGHAVHPAVQKMPAIRHAEVKGSDPRKSLGKTTLEKYRSRMGDGACHET
jgi:hypothetical protein